jgi:uracil-DNA glycosylase family 4
VSNDLHAEARAIAASLREVVAELADEGVDVLDIPQIETAAMAPPSAPQVQTRPQQPVTPAPASPAAPAAPKTPKTETPPSVPLTLDAVREELGDCRRCGLCEGRKEIVFGSGNPNADLMFIGEGPGEQEDIQGLPFVGRAGELLTQMIEKGIQIPRDDVYICNIVKCRPPKNRNPLPDEVSACKPFLDGQIDAVKPKVIISLGEPAAGLLLGREVAITGMRGTWHSYRGIPLMPTLHPAFVLRQYTPENRRFVWEDLKAAVEKSRS